MQETFFSKLANTSKDAIVVIDSQEKVIFWNEAAIRSFGYTENEALGQNLHKLIIPERFQSAHTHNTFTKNHHQDAAHDRMIEVMAVNKQGHEIPFEVSISSIVYEGQMYWAGFMRNITDKKKRENELKEAKSLAEAASAAKSEFLANMSHEIRTPMNVIIGLTDHILDSDEQEMTHKNICMVNDAAKLLLNIINQILDFSKVEAGKLELNKAAFDISGTLHRLIEIMESTAAEKNIDLVLYYDSSIPRVAIGDAVRLQQVLINLLGNAIKFTDQGKVELYVKLLSERQLPASHKSIKLQITVIDSGIGIAADKMAGLFESFSQVDNSLARPYEGTGLGLSISRKLVQLMGGEITVKSQLGAGSQFSFDIELEVDGTKADQVLTLESWRLPGSSRCRVCEHPANQVARKPETAEVTDVSDSSDCQDINILLVEDKPMNQMLARTILQKQGWRVATADNGLIALEKITTASYDVILMDIQMPELDGVETTKRIRALKNNPNSRTPIIAMTANAMAGDRERYLEQGMDDYIGKPFVAADLKALIIKHCKNDSQKNMQTSLQAALKMLQEDRDLLVNIIEAFVEDCKQDIQKLQQAVATKDAQLIIETAHGIKGELGNIRLTYWYDLAYRLELDANTGYSEDLADNTQQFINELDKLLQYLEEDNWLAQLGG